MLAAPSTADGHHFIFHSTIHGDTYPQKTMSKTNVKWRFKHFALLALSTMDGVVLPVVEDIPFEGWSSWWQSEEDLWTEAAALRREGWSSAWWRQWQQLLVEEARRRREWWQLLVQWSQLRWGGVLGQGSDW
jgi:hypothetical protein